MCVLLPALQCAYPPMLINKARNCYLLVNVYCQFCCWTVYHSGARLQSSLDLGGQRTGWEDALSPPLFYLTALVVMASHSLALLANMPGNITH